MQAVRREVENVNGSVYTVSSFNSRSLYLLSVRVGQKIEKEKDRDEPIG